MIFAALIQTPPDAWSCCLVMVFVCVRASLHVLGMKQQLHILENDNWSPRTYSGSMKLYRTISKHPIRLSGSIIFRVLCRLQKCGERKMNDFLVVVPPKAWKTEETLQISFFWSTSELPASQCKCTYIDWCTYLSSIFTFKNPDVSTMYNILTNHFQSIKHVLLGLLTLSKTLVRAIRSLRTFHQPISVKTAAVGLEKLIMDFQSELIQGYENNTSIPKHSMYGICTYKYHKYTIHIQYPYIECLG